MSEGKVNTSQVDTNIQNHHREVFDALTSGEYENFALYSCFVNGEPACAIVVAETRGETAMLIPLFVSLTPLMLLTGHDGREVKERETEGGEG